MDNKEILCFLLNKRIPIKEYKKDLVSLTQEDWKDLLFLSSRYSLKPLLYAKLRPFLKETGIPTFVSEDLRKAHIESVYKNTLIFRHVSILLTALIAENVPVIGLKGIFLLENVYNNIAARPLGDIDILVRKKDLQTAIRILKTLGYTMDTYFSLQDQNTDVKHTPPMKNKDGLSIEIHWTILSENEPFKIDTGGLWDRALSVKIADVDVLALSPEDLVLHLSIHFAYQHHLKLGLRGLNDIAEVLHYYEKHLDWGAIEKRSQKWGVDKVIWLALSLAEELLDAPVPSEVLFHLRPEDVEPWVLQNARSILLNAREMSVPMTPNLANFANERGVINKLRILVSRVFLARKTLARLYDVSPTSVKIYSCYLRRLRGLIQGYGPGLGQVLKKDAGVRSSLKVQQEVEKLQTWMINI